MASEEADNLGDLLDRASRLDGEQRTTFLSAVLRDHPELRARVESMLQPEDDTLLMEVPPAPAPRKGLEGKRVGAYRILRTIGRGGMGEVCLAVRCDDEFNKQVAIKLLRPIGEAEEVSRRFRVERQILASLDHPNIVKLLDGGSTEDGSPYIVMDYVEGKPIDAYCRENRLPTRDRLELFRTVCSAVQYAHQRLIVHRDLKPSNILVTPAAVPKLLDFGIAKLLGRDFSLRDDGITLPGMVMMTPEYASPEQMLGEAITTASDVYSLGVLLYELLTGRRPYDLSHRSIQEIITLVARGKEPERPSAACTGSPEDDSQRLSRTLRGDLDTIVLMALRRETARRYQSAEQLSEDLRRHLAGLPVSARPDTFSYRASKFVRRNRAGVAAAAAIVVCLAAGVLSTVFQAQEAERQRVRAERRFNQVRQLARGFLFDIHDLIWPLAGSTPARLATVELGQRYLDSLVKEAGGDASLLRELAEAYQRMGDVQGNPRFPHLGNTAAAMQNYRRALDIRSSLPPGSGGPELEREIALNHSRIADMHWAMGDSRAALEEYRLCGTLLSRVLARSPDPTRVRREMGANHNDMGDLLVEAQKYTQAGEEYGQSLLIARDLDRAKPGDLQGREDLAQSLSKNGDVRWYQNDFRGAVARYREALAIREELAAAYPNNHIVARKVMLTHLSVGDALLSAADQAAALPHYRNSVQLAEKLRAADPMNNQSRRDLAVAYSRLADAHLKSRSHAAALEYIRKVAEIHQAAVEADPKSAVARRDLAITWSEMGGIYSEMAAQSGAGRNLHRQQAIRWYGQSAAAFEEMERGGLLTDRERAIRASVTEALDKLRGAAAGRE